jgi:CheY-like chemotaxis protein
MAAYSIKMLVADDSRTVQLFFKNIVERSSLPIELLTADTGPECMMFLEQGGVDLAFIDVNMPEMSGMEAVSRVRFKGNKTFVTLMSGKADERRYEVARQIRAYEYLVKPFSAADIEAILKIYQRVSVRMQTLIVDDSRTIRHVIKRVLERSVFRLSIDEAVDGERALARFSDGGYDLVFLDYNMPGLDGLDTLDRIRANSPATKIIMISAERNDARVSNALGHGAVAFLYKPFFASDIDRALHVALGLKVPDLITREDPSRRGATAREMCPVDAEPGLEEWSVAGGVEKDAKIGDATTEPSASG